jgi:hypothetical protein
MVMVGDVWWVGGGDVEEERMEEEVGGESFKEFPKKMEL